MVAMEEGEERGTCFRHTQELRERIVAEMQSDKRLKKSKFGHTKDYAQCKIL